jgi:hypothetical protein
MKSSKARDRAELDDRDQFIDIASQCLVRHQFALETELFVWLRLVVDRILDVAVGNRRAPLNLGIISSCGAENDRAMPGGDRQSTTSCSDSLIEWPD